MDRLKQNGSHFQPVSVWQSINQRNRHPIREIGITKPHTSFLSSPAFQVSSPVNEERELLAAWHARVQGSGDRL
jgi:hypothetical protein